MFEFAMLIGFLYAGLARLLPSSPGADGEENGKGQRWPGAASRRRKGRSESSPRRRKRHGPTDRQAQNRRASQSLADVLGYGPFLQAGTVNGRKWGGAGSGGGSAVH